MTPERLTIWPMANHLRCIFTLDLKLALTCTILSPLIKGVKRLWITCMPCSMPTRPSPSMAGTPPTTAPWRCTPCTRWGPVPNSCSTSSPIGRPPRPCRPGRTIRAKKRRPCSWSCASSWCSASPKRAGCPASRPCWRGAAHPRGAPFTPSSASPARWKMAMWESRRRRWPPGSARP
ncbi:hypothetical protein D3C79_865030 [compost metagenome]